MILFILLNSSCIPNSSDTDLNSSLYSLRRSSPPVSSICSSLLSMALIGITRDSSPNFLDTCIFSNIYRYSPDICSPINGISRDVAFGPLTKLRIIPGRSVTLLVVVYVRKKSPVAVGRISFALRWLISAPGYL